MARHHVLLFVAAASSCALAPPPHRPRQSTRLSARRHHAPRHAAVTAALSVPTVADAGILATGLSYLVGVGSLLLYTPIAVRIIRKGRADGLTLSTWWLKLASYSASDIYAYSSGYPIAQYVETLVITLEAIAILLLVGRYQRRIDGTFAALAVAYALAAGWALTLAPPAALAVAQGGATLLNTGALLPQLALNARSRSTGDYSPLTASLACAGCLIRIFTTYDLRAISVRSPCDLRRSVRSPLRSQVRARGRRPAAARWFRRRPRPQQRPPRPGDLPPSRSISPCISPCSPTLCGSLSV